ncbi:MAG: hypothetical protein ALECFALPRED_005840 [Alectoria fallacina]|uniref:Thioredoxin n=1 Tax=Alectoria fallacina TaxID=1903189 RepID=A0A8H3G6K7_9LECA|nr:MAG: hypothetical protein ALECFALPRED_005840 [Alectoria fallacina]
MEVQLYVYDISKGLARQMSGQLLGIQIDAVYHTALVFGGIEYFFGSGVQTSYPGGTHHGRPMEVIPMGTTQLPLEVILEYLESLRAIYTTESYDLFLHNCNNFTNDFSMFLVGKGIPDHISSLPQTVLNTPFGQMLKPQLDNAMRGITQAPVPPNHVPQATARPQSIPNGLSSRPQTNMSISQKKEEVPGVVYRPTRLKQLDELLASARDSCAVIFFTSSTCAPCKIVYPAYDELAAEAGSKATLIKVDVNDAYEIGAKYQVRATPTFMTFIKGEKESEWSGANEAKLRGNVRLLIQMAHPPHPHTLLRLPTLQRLHKTPVTYTKIPPIEKLIAKMGPSGSNPAVGTLKEFITTRQQSGAVEAPLPNLPAITTFISKSFQTLPPESLFPIVDLFRLALVDPRVSGYYAEDASEIVFRILNTVNRLDMSCPYQLRIVTLHMACNLFTSQLFPIKLFLKPTYSAPLFQLVTSSLLDNEHPPVRVAASSLAFNMAASNHQQRMEGNADFLPESSQVELVASLLEAMGRERESKDGMRGLLLAVGLLKYMTAKGGEVDDLCEAVGAKGIITEAKGAFPDLKELAKEVEQVM